MDKRCAAPECKKRRELDDVICAVNNMPISEVPLEMIEFEPCRDLWMALFKGLWDDVFDARRAGQAERDARRWFGSRDFFIVCSLCGLDGHAVLAKYKEALVALDGVAA